MQAKGVLSYGEIQENLIYGEVGAMRRKRFAGRSASAICFITFIGLILLTVMLPALKRPPHLESRMVAVSERRGHSIALIQAFLTTTAWRGAPISSTQSATRQKYSSGDFRMAAIFFSKTWPCSSLEGRPYFRTSASSGRSPNAVCAKYNLTGAFQTLSDFSRNI